jgi:hypothetical protein
VLPPSSGSCLLPASHWFLAWHIQLGRWRWNDPSVLWLPFNGPHSIISQKTGIFVTTAARMSNPKCEITVCLIRNRISNVISHCFFILLYNSHERAPSPNIIYPFWYWSNGWPVISTVSINFVQNSSVSWWSKCLDILITITLAWVIKSHSILHVVAENSAMQYTLNMRGLLLSVGD